jgi:hypothetical protein
VFNMPHLIKKVVNAFESSGKWETKRNLHFQGKKLDLRMLRNLWEESGDADGTASLRRCHYSIDHFKKKSYNRMRVYLAVQITSMTMIRMIENHAEQCGGIEAYSSIVQVI